MLCWSMSIYLQGKPHRSVVADSPFVSSSPHIFTTADPNLVILAKLNYSILTIVILNFPVTENETLKLKVQFIRPCLLRYCIYCWENYSIGLRTVQLLHGWGNANCTLDDFSLGKIKHTLFHSNFIYLGPFIKWVYFLNICIW